MGIWIEGSMSLTLSFHNSNPPGTVTGMKQKSLNTVALFIDPKAMQRRMEKHFLVSQSAQEGSRQIK